MIATVLAVAVVAHEFIDDLSWPVCFVLGAIVGPTDPVAATAIMRRLGVPRRLVSVVEGESLLNDATALVAYRIALAAVGGAAFSLLDAGWEFLWKASGGIAIGLIVGCVIAEIRKRLDDPLIENTIGLLTAYAAYVPAEQLQVSAVLAAVTVGCYVGWRAPEIAGAETRLQGFGMWELLQFLLNALLFVLIGLQLPSIVDALGDFSTRTLLGYGALVSAAVIVTRLVWQFTIVYVDPRAGPARERARAARALAVALHHRLGRDARRGLARRRARARERLPAARPDRLPHVRGDLHDARAPGAHAAVDDPVLGVHDDGSEEHEELKGRLMAAKAALARIDELEGEEWTRDDTIERMRGLYRYRKRRFAARAGLASDDEGFEDRSAAYQTLVREVLEAQRREIVRLRNSGDISNDVMHRLERELDLEDSRLEI